MDKRRAHPSCNNTKARRRWRCFRLLLLDTTGAQVLAATRQATADVHLSAIFTAQGKKHCVILVKARLCKLDLSPRCCQSE